MLGRPMGVISETAVSDAPVETAIGSEGETATEVVCELMGHFHDDALGAWIDFQWCLLDGELAQDVPSRLRLAVAEKHTAVFSEIRVKSQPVDTCFKVNLVAELLAEVEKDGRLMAVAIIWEHLDQASLQSDDLDGFIASRVSVNDGTVRKLEFGPSWFQVVGGSVKAGHNACEADEKRLPHG